MPKGLSKANHNTYCTTPQWGLVGSWQDWSVFVQKLSNISDSYSPEDDDKDTIVSISFPNNGKAVDYFICFAKYQNHICWDERALCKVVKDAIPNHIRDELCYSIEDVSMFEGFKRVVLHINNNHWKRIQDDKNKLQNNCPFHSTYPRLQDRNPREACGQRRELTPSKSRRSSQQHWRPHLGHQLSEFPPVTY